MQKPATRDDGHWNTNLRSYKGLCRVDTTRNPVLIRAGLLTSLLPTVLLFVSVNIYFFVPLVVGIGCVGVGLAKMPTVAKQRATFIGLLLCLVASLGPFALGAYANRSGNPIRIVLPAGFRGEFSIVKDRTKGQDLKLQDDVWVFEMPANGVLIVNDDYPLYMWHQATYVYSDGHPATVKALGVTLGRIRTGPGSSSGRRSSGRQGPPGSAPCRSGRGGG